MTKKSKLLALGGVALIAVLSFVLYSSASTESLQGNMFQNASELTTSRVSSRLLPVVNNADLSVSIRNLNVEEVRSEGEILQLFTINYAVKAGPKDVFIDGAPDDLAVIGGRSRGTAYVVADTTSVYEASGSTSSGASVTNGYYRVRRGSTVNFTTFVEVETNSPVTSVGLERLGYTTNAKVVQTAADPDKVIRRIFGFTKQKVEVPARIELFSQEVEKTTLPGESDIATFTYEFTVEAQTDQNIFIANTATDTDMLDNTSIINLHYELDTFPRTATLREPVAEISSSADSAIGVFEVEAGETENFTLTIQAQADEFNALVTAGLKALVYSNETGATFTHTFDYADTRQSVSLTSAGDVDMAEDEDVEDTDPIEISFVSQNVVKESLEGRPDTGIYTFVFDVAAATDTYISRDLQALSGPTAPVGASLFASSNETNDGNPTGVITSSADLAGGLYFVEAGRTERFTATVNVTPTATGFFEISLHRLAFKLNSPEGRFTSELFPSLVNFRQTTQLTFR